MIKSNYLAMHISTICSVVTKSTILIFILFLFCKCEDSVDVDLSDHEQQLVVETNFRIFPDSSYSMARLDLTRSTSYFDNTRIPVLDAKIYLTNLENQEVTNFESRTDFGTYVPSTGNNPFQFEENTDYEVSIEVNGKTYRGISKSSPPVKIQNIKFEGNQVIDGEKIVELRIFFTDNRSQNNYYAFDDRGFRIYEVLADDFFNGELFNFSIFVRESEIIDSKITVDLQAVNKTYFNYLQKIIELDAPQLYGPFATPPTIPRGNIMSETDKKEYMLGFFHISATHSQSYKFDDSK